MVIGTGIGVGLISKSGGIYDSSNLAKKSDNIISWLEWYLTRVGNESCCSISGGSEDLVGSTASDQFGATCNDIAVGSTDRSTDSIEFHAGCGQCSRRVRSKGEDNILGRSNGD